MIWVDCSLSYPVLVSNIPLDSVQGDMVCVESSWLLIIIERVMLLTWFHAFWMIMGFIESGPAALSE